jgi:hypothetical protein
VDLKVLARLGDIPVGATVTKIGGVKEYLVRDRVDIYDEQGTQHRIHANDGCYYLIGDGYINAYGFEKKLIWHTSLEELNNVYQEGMEAGS